jgi:hypothetical protein
MSAEAVSRIGCLLDGVLTDPDAALEATSGTE